MRTRRAVGQGRRSGRARPAGRGRRHHRPVDRSASALRSPAQRHTAKSGAVPAGTGLILSRFFIPNGADGGARCGAETRGEACPHPLLFVPPGNMSGQFDDVIPPVPSPMISNILTRIFGSRNERLLKQYGQAVREINALEPGIAALSDDELKAKTTEFKARVANGETLDDVLPEAFAVVREAGKRALKMRHFDVQLIGGMALHNGKIAEMRTGEGKTLVATLPAYLNALSGKGVHVVTVNDYLAQRDADWMGRIYSFLGLTVGVNLSQMAHADKQVAYAADITYGTNNEFGFDYLRDNMVFAVGRARAARAQLRDRRRSRLDPDRRGAHAADHLRPGRRQRRDVLPPERAGAASSSRQTEEKPARATTGSTKRRTRCCCRRRATSTRKRSSRRRVCIPAGSSLYDAHNISLVHHLYAALRAHSLFHRDQHYVVQNGEVVIVDEFTGRLMAGRRWSDGLAPGGRGEGRRADPAREPDARVDHVPELFPHVRQARRHDRHGRHRSVRVPADLSPGNGGHPDAPADGPQGRERPRVPHASRKRSTRSSPTSRTATRAASRCWSAPRRSRTPSCSSTYLDKEKLPHQVLNAKQHAREAEIVAQAGTAGVITIATNMAGRGTDIVLGGSIEPLILRLRDDEALEPEEKEREIANDARRLAGAPRRGDRRPAACTSSAPSATSRGASTTSCAAAPAARATPARRASTCRSRIRCCASSAASGSAPSCSS